MQINSGLNISDLHDLIEQMSFESNINSTIIEKDFWVCYMLDYIFGRNPLKKSFTFKGGTSLSKCYNLIRRFSEDIDLILDWRLLGYGIDEPWQGRSKNQQNKFENQVQDRTEKFIKNELIPVFRSDLSDEWEGQLSIDYQSEDQSVLVRYPSLSRSSYIPNYIKLEIGSLAAWTPSETVKIKPILQKSFPKYITGSVELNTVSAERTFWEKITILHKEANRDNSKTIPARYSRHYYDIYCMNHSEIKDSALSQLDLRKKVINFKNKFYYQPWANYNEILSGQLKLIPSDKHQLDLRNDYKDMEDMFFESYLSFDEIMNSLQKLETEINSLTE